MYMCNKIVKHDIINFSTKHLHVLSNTNVINNVILLYKTFEQKFLSFIIGYE